MSVVTRRELGALIKEDSYKIVLLTASVFVLAGSLWAHFALSSSFFVPEFFVLWALLHFQPFVALLRPNLLRALSALAFFTLHIYFYFAFYVLDLPFVPMAPLFFVITALTFPTLQFERKRWSVFFWAACWVSVLGWSYSSVGEAHRSQIMLPVAVGSVISLTFHSGFFIIQRFFSVRLSQYLKEIGPKNTFDVKRIQASKLQTLGEITASLLHEINNPLTNINGYSHQVSEALRDEDEDMLEIVESSNDRIKFNVDRIKDITSAVRRLVRPASKSEIEKVGVRALMEDALTLTKHHLRSQGIEVVTSFANIDVSVNGNFTELSQIIVNLLTNARDAVKHSEEKKITLGFLLENEQVKIWVEDTGPGVDSSIEGDIFKPFFTTKASEEGTGLGLYISQMIAQRNKAALSYVSLNDSSEQKSGTRFTLVMKVLTVDVSDSHAA